MFVYCVKDDWGDFTVLASSIQSLILHLIKTGVLNENVDILVDNPETNHCEWTILKDFYGDCWKNTISNLTIDELNDLFNGFGLTFSKEKVID